jgi:hypothetical protein
MMNNEHVPLGGFLPVSVILPFGPQSEDVKEMQEAIVARIQVPAAFDLSDLEAGSHVHVAQESDTVLRLIEAYRQSADPDDVKERNIDVLEHVSRDPINHAVVVEFSSQGLLRFVVLRRSIEYVAGQDGTPLVVRMIHDVAAAHYKGSLHTDDLMQACGAAVLADLVKLHLDIAEIATHLDAQEVPYHGLEQQLPFMLEPALRVESHVKGSVGDNDYAVHAIGTLIETYSGHWAGIRDPNHTPGPAYFVGPYYPGSWFTAKQSSSGRDTRESLRAREILRSASLIAHSNLRRVTPAETPDFVPGRRVETIVSEYASLEALAAGGFALGLDVKDPRSVFGFFGEDVKTGLLYIFEVTNRALSAYVGIERTLSLTLEAGVMMPLTLDLKLGHMLGEVQEPMIADRIAEVFLDQAISDVFSLQSSLSAFSGDILVRFRVPSALAAHFRQVISQDWKESLDAIGYEGSHHRVREPVTIEEDVWPDHEEPHVPEVLFQQLPTGVSIDPNSILEAASDEVEDDVDDLEVLRCRDGKAEWVHLEELEEDETDEPFWLLRTWVGGMAQPVVYSTVSGRNIDGGEWYPQELVANFSHTLASLPQTVKTVALSPRGVAKLREAAERLFSHANIKVAPIETVFLNADAYDAVFGDRLSEEDESLLDHLATCADPDRDWEDPLDGEWEMTRPSDFIVAVHDDLRLSDDFKGADAILAEFLSGRAFALLGYGDDLFRSTMFIVALAYVRRILNSAGAPLLAKSDIRIVRNNLRYAWDQRVSEAKISSAISAAIEEVSQGTPKVRIYLAVARVAQAFEAVVDLASMVTERRVAY